MRYHRRLAIPLIVLAVPAIMAAGLEDSNRQLQQALNDSEVHASWIYNDVSAGFAQARRTGKPLLVVFR